jgi:hypothetical protein
VAACIRWGSSASQPLAEHWLYSVSEAEHPLWYASRFPSGDAGARLAKAVLKPRPCGEAAPYWGGGGGGGGETGVVVGGGGGGCLGREAQGANCGGRGGAKGGLLANTGAWRFDALTQRCYPAPLLGTGRKAPHRRSVLPAGRDNFSGP